MYCDYHLHSSFSGDSKTPMEEMIRQGIRLGLPAMCFTEHLDPDFPDGDCSFDLDIPAYQEKLMELKGILSGPYPDLFRTGTGTSASSDQRDPPDRRFCSL